tara:strand:- start:915 stop:1322 length:408 start_codon:yes stop_codon:yes gene_type:complete
MLATTAKSVAASALIFKASSACKTKGAVKSSTVDPDAIDLTSKIVNSELPDKITVRSLAELLFELHTKRDFTIAVLNGPQVYNTAAEVVGTCFAFTYTLDITLKTTLLHLNGLLRYSLAPLNIGPRKWKKNGLFR